MDNANYKYTIISIYGGKIHGYYKDFERKREIQR
jgi:hypothetical protein